jgi:phage terminase large subunit GpA-like protein
VIDVAALYDASFNDGLRPDPLLTVSEWADQFRMLSQTASAEPGRWRTDRTPYLREIMDCLSPSSGVEKVVFMKGAQVGGTEAGNNWIGYVIDQAPGPMLVVLPTVEMGKRWSKGRFAPLIDDTPAIRAKVKDPRSRDAGNTVQSKEFPGGIVVITGANSAVGLRSMPVRYLFMDEIDGYPGDADGEGDPVSLAVQRTATFARRKILEVSTPTVSGLSRIEKEFQTTDQRFFHVPCIVCGHMQVLKWAQLRWQDNDPATVHYHCEACGTPIPNHGKSRMLEGGEWRSTAVGDGGKTRGYHLSSLYSPVGWFSWEEAVRAFLKAKDDETLLKVWVNTTLGETWVEKGEAPDWQRLYERREDYPIGEIPAAAVVLTAGADVQKDRIEVEVVAWGKGKESWSVAYQVLTGDPAQTAVWLDLAVLLQTTYRHPSGVDLPIAMLAIDSGYATQSVYDWVRRQASGRVMAVKGMERAIAPLGSPSTVDVTIGGKRLRRGVKVWPVGVGLIKSELYQWLQLAPDENGFPSGYCHFPRYDAEYFKQLTAEQLVTKTVKGYPKREWQKLRERNEALDCRIYARAAAIALGMDRWNAARWDALAGQLIPVNNRPSVAVSEPITPNKPVRSRVTRSRWMS